MEQIVQKSSEQDKAERKLRKALRESMIVNFTAKQKLALENAIKKSKIHEKNLIFQIQTKFIENAIDESYIEKISNHFTQHASLTTKMRSTSSKTGNCIFEILCQDPRLKNCFELGNKDQGYYEYRKKKENFIFVNAYQESENHERPKYGSVNFKNDYYGDPLCTMYGDITLIYRDEVKHKASFTYGNSEATMYYVCTFEHNKHILYHMSVKDIQTMISIVDGKACGNLSCYIEAQLHGDIDISTDVQRIMVPRSVYDSQKAHVEKFKTKYPKVEIVVF